MCPLGLSGQAHLRGLIAWAGRKGERPPRPPACPTHRWLLTFLWHTAGPQPPCSQQRLVLHGHTLLLPLPSSLPSLGEGTFPNPGDLVGLAASPLPGSWRQPRACTSAPQRDPFYP